MSTDAELLQRYARENSEAAFAKLVQRHLPLVYSSALRQLGGDTHLAQDVTQTVFTALARKAADLSGCATLAGWLYLSTHHAAAQAVRGNRRREAREQEAHAMHEILGSSTSATDWDQVRPVLDEAMRDLGGTDREAVLLRFFEQRPFADIGAALNLTEDAARMRVERALDKLHALLTRRGITSSTAALAAVFANQAMVAAPGGLAATVTSLALAGAGTATATAFLMSKTTAILGAVALAAIGAGAYQIRQTHRAEIAVASLGRERDSLRGQLRDTQQHVAEVDRQVVSLRQELESARAAKAGPPASALSRRAGSPASGTISIGRTESGVVSGNRALIAEAVNAVYPALYRQLGWTPAQREQFTTLMCDWKERTNELMGAAFAQGAIPANPDGRAALGAIKDQTEAELQLTLRSAFGDAGAEAIRHFDATQPMRAAADKLASALFYTDTPLTPTQADQLVEIMANNARTAQGTFSMPAMNSEVVFAQALSVLTAPQVAALRQVDAQRRREQEVAAKMQAERNGAGNAAGAAKPPGN